MFFGWLACVLGLDNCEEFAVTCINPRIKKRVHVNISIYFGNVFGWLMLACVLGLDKCEEFAMTCINPKNVFMWKWRLAIGNVVFLLWWGKIYLIVLKKKKMSKKKNIGEKNIVFYIKQL